MLLNRKISILYFVNNIKWQILFVITFALAVGFLHLRPEFKGIDIPLNILTLLGTIVTILLAFRTSQSYERWWEARTIWGAIVNDSRTLTRTVLQFLPENESVEKKKFAEHRNLTLPQTLALGCALSMNNIGIGFSASITGLPFLPASISTFFCSFGFLTLGSRLGRSVLLQQVGEYADPISGLLLILLGLWQLYH